MSHPVISVLFHSRTRDGLTHEAWVDEHDVWRCTCEGYDYLRRCWHLKAAVRMAPVAKEIAAEPRPRRKRAS
jgi:hypothetical protein